MIHRTKKTGRSMFAETSRVSLKDHALTQALRRDSLAEELIGECLRNELLGKILDSSQSLRKIGRAHV